MKLSDNAKKAVKALKKINKDFREFVDAMEHLTDKERALVGATIVAIFSPAGEIGIVGGAGPSFTISGLEKEIEDKAKSDRKEQGLNDMLTKMMAMMPRERTGLEKKEEEIIN